MQPINVALFVQFTANDAPPNTIGATPFIFTYNKFIYLVWIYDIGVYFIAVNSLGQYCKYSTLSFYVAGQRPIENGNSICFIDNGTIYFANSTGHFGTVPIPQFFSNHSFISVIPNNITKVVSDCNFNIITRGPFLIGGTLNPVVGYVMTDGANNYAGTSYSFYGNKECEQYVIIYDDSSNATLTNYGTSSTNVIDSTSTQMSSDALGHDNICNISDLSATRTNGVFCRDPLHPLNVGTFTFHINYYPVLQIPDERNYNRGASDNDYIGVFGSATGPNYPCYLTSPILSYSLFITQNAIVCNKQILMGNKLYFFGPYNPPNLYVSTNLANYFTTNDFPSGDGSGFGLGLGLGLGSSNGPPSSSSSTVNKSFKSQYLINMNRPISAIGAYKT